MLIYIPKITNAKVKNNNIWYVASGLEPARPQVTDYIYADLYVYPLNNFEYDIDIVCYLYPK